MTEALIVGAVRTPIGKYGGALAAARPDDLAALVVREAIRRARVDPAEVDEVILGAANQAGEDNRNVARMAALLAGLGEGVPGITVNRLCASGMSAVDIASSLVKSGAADVVVAGGVESMTRAPWVMEKPSGKWAKPGGVWDTSIGWRFTNPVFASQDKLTYSMPETAEHVGALKGITREEADVFALTSHERALAAQAAGRFDAEIVPVEVSPARDWAGAPPVVVSADEGPRPGCTRAALARLRPVTPGGSLVTAGNASSLNDGAAALVVASRDAVTRLGLFPTARVVAGTAAGVSPEVMGLGPIPATRKLMARTGWETDGIDAVELNEAFATQAIACVRELGLDSSKVNAEGGAIALGHPLGCSGARLLVTLLHRLERRGGGRGLATMCVGVGQGTALAVETCDGDRPQWIGVPTGPKAATVDLASQAWGTEGQS
jgi:acetyl-CoA C-acetyltransferase